MNRLRRESRRLIEDGLQIECHIEGWVGATVAGVAAVAGGVASYEGASKAANAANNATNNSRDEFNTINAQEQPYMQAGNAAAGRLADLLGTSGNTGATGYGSLNAPFTAQNYLDNQDPGFEFQREMGAQALRNADTPGVGSLSGAALKDLVTFNQNTAATGYQNAFNRYQTQQNNTYNRLYSLAGLGQNAASNTGTQGVALAGQEANSILAGGNAQANGIQGVGNSLASLAYLGSGGNNSTPSFTPQTFTPSESDLPAWDPNANFGAGSNVVVSGD